MKPAQIPDKVKKRANDRTLEQSRAALAIHNVPLSDAPTRRTLTQISYVPHDPTPTMLLSVARRVRPAPLHYVWLSRPTEVLGPPAPRLSPLRASISALSASYSATLRARKAPVSRAFSAIPPGVSM